ncbi:MAG: undecaprenyldiphospho-muramoylpentapeptide beta-N-acetylglucosaminyltransferase, partial [Chloroflexi bacterium]|nr:undecaprenyldiphospho-muramoylpentapeptide beta-N-acetylglucosaminyltransferase [Chloroflexota bacterium]
AYLAGHQAAIVINDADLGRSLKDTVINLMTHREKLETMRQACRRLAQPEAAARLAQEILRVGKHGH